MKIRRETLTSPAASSLISATNAELLQRYPEPGACHFKLGPDEVADGRGAFFVAYVEEQPVGCGAVRRLDDSMAELKRMYVRPTYRGQGIGRAILAALESEARKLGVTRLVLETGTRQMEAIAMYRRAGFGDIPPYGEYVGSGFSICMEKLL
jgi:GNAT superfamily N-acetyltransferase